jgi:hypothetical protein
MQLYQASTLVSIHNDSCEYVNDEATGFKVAAAMSSPFPEKANRLTVLPDPALPGYHWDEVSLQHHHTRYDKLSYL